MKKIFSILIMLIFSVSAYALSIGQRADSAYNAENYRLAIDLYQKSLAEEGRSSDLYYNLGNAYYRSDKLGMAVVCYERSLRLDPTNDDARSNLEFVRSRIMDRRKTIQHSLPRCIIRYLAR